MNYPSEDIDPNQADYLRKKRHEEPIQKENRPNYENYDKYHRYDKYCPNEKYKYFNKFHTKFPKDNYYYNRNYKYKNYYYNSPKKYYKSGYSNKFYEKRDYKNYYQNNSPEEIRNISNYEMIFPHSISIKEKEEESSLNSYPASTNLASPIKSFNSKDFKKLSKFSSENFNNEIDFKYSENFDKKEEKEISEDFKSEEKEKEKQEDLLDMNDKFEKHQYFNKDLIQLEENPLKFFEVYPKNLFEFKRNIQIDNSKNNVETKNNIISLDSCYLLAKIPNWRLVSKFVPVSSLKKEKFEKFLEKIDEDENEDIDKDKNENGEIKTNIIYSEKYEEIVNGYLKESMNKLKKIEYEYLNRKLICTQFQYDILDIKNKILQKKYEMGLLNIQKDNLCSAIEEIKIH